MFVYPKPLNPSRSRKRQRRYNVSTKARQLQSKNNSRNTSKITKLNSKSSSLPNWLKSFRVLQASSTLVAFCLIATTLFLYSWTVYNQQTWGRQYKNLENLQKQERDLTSTNESVKNTLAEDTNLENSDLIPATPEKLLFINSADTNKSESKKTQLPTSSAKIKRPVGY